MNAAATAKNIGMTLRAVRIGCQAGRRCCLNAVSEMRNNHQTSK